MYARHKNKNQTAEGTEGPNVREGKGWWSWDQKDGGIL